MASIKYQVDGAPPAGAFYPVPCPSSTKAWNNGVVKVTGHPGDMRVTSPKPSAIPNGPLMRGAQPSYNSPDYILPSVYYPSAANMGPNSSGIRVRSTNEVPIPARGTQRTAQVAYRRPRFGGLRQVTWPPAPQAWQNINLGAQQG